MDAIIGSLFARYFTLGRNMRDVVQLAKLLADPARAAMVWTLIDGTSRPAGELAFAANVSPQSASAHLAKLVAGGLLHSEAQGRHRYFRIAGADAADLIERLASFSAKAGVRAPPHPPLARAMPAQFLQARTCYDHLAGELAVRLLDAMLQAKWLVCAEEVFEATALGRRRFDALGVEVGVKSGSRRAYARSCIDLTQRRPHLSGALGAALLSCFVREGWVLRAPQSRVVSVTPKGWSALHQSFGISSLS
jgi:DNA-binding transcriptional ArsR family regulator